MTVSLLIAGEDSQLIFRIAIRAKLSFLYSEEENSVEMDISWRGDQEDALAQADPISLALGKANTEKIQCSYEDGSNQIRTTICATTRFS